MLLSTKCDYGVRALIDLARYANEGPVQRSEIAKRRKIPESYLDHLLAQLRRGGYVKSVRGPGGGHSLAFDSNKMNLLEVLETLEGSLAPMGCVTDLSEDDGRAVCGQQWIWQEIYRFMCERLADTTIDDLVLHEQDHERENAARYSI